MPANITFDALVDNLRDLSLDEQVEMKDILEKSIIEHKRSEILKNAKLSKKEYKKGNLNFNSDVSVLMDSLLED